MPYTCFPWTCQKALANFGKQHVSPRPAPGIRNHPAPIFCPPIVISKLMMSLPGPPTRVGIFDNPGWYIPRSHACVVMGVIVM